MTAAAVANRVRTQPTRVRAGRIVQIRLTDFARPGYRGGFATLFGPSPDQAVQYLLSHLGVEPHEIQARPQQLGDVAILRRMPADVPREYQPGTIQPVAFVEGLAAHEIAESLSWLSPRDAA